MTIPLFDPRREETELEGEISRAVAAVLSSGAYILGPEVEAFEKEVAGWLGVEHAVGVGNGTDALTVALRAIGVGPGDAVITSPFTFFATASAIMSAGATPVFADIEEGSFNLDAAQVQAALEGKSPTLRRAGITPSQVKAILPVHLYGQSADMTLLGELASAFDLPVLEDAAQAFGACWEGRNVGGFGAAGCFSFFPTKNLGTAGDGGLLTTNDTQVADLARAIRAHGSRERYRHDIVGTNTRLDSIHAAILRCKLPHVAGAIDRRRQHAELYQQSLPRSGPLTPPVESPAARHSYNQFTIRVDGGLRDAVRSAFTDAGIGTAIYYPIPVHLQPALEQFGYRAGDFPVAETACDEVLSIPIWPGLTEEEVSAVASALARQSECPGIPL